MNGTWTAWGEEQVRPPRQTRFSGLMTDVQDRKTQVVHGTILDNERPDHVYVSAAPVSPSVPKMSTMNLPTAFHPPFGVDHPGRGKPHICSRSRVFNGDIITGENVFEHNATAYLDMCFKPTADRGITFSCVHGNVRAFAAELNSVLSSINGGSLTGIAR